MIKRIQVSFILVCFVFNLGLPSLSFAQSSPDTFLNLPAPGSMLSTSPAFTPAIVRGLQIDPKNPLQFNFIVDTGDANVQGDELRAESSEMIKYFLTALTVPEKELWVNLSPYEKDRIIANGLGQTDMGRDMLSQDYVLKQLTASMIYPEGSIGKEFWAKVYKEAQEKYGTTQIPVNTFNKVWIVPDHASIYEHNGTAFVTENKLKVMLEQDYLSLQKHMNNNDVPVKAATQDTSTLGSQIIREIVLPQLEKEVNQGKNFAQLRQIANAVVLATWYKMNLKQSLLGQVYANQNKVAGVDVQDKKVKMEIYEQYLKAFKKGVYNYIKDDVDPLTNQTVPRKYFSGGEIWNYTGKIRSTDTIDVAQVAEEENRSVIVGWTAAPLETPTAKNPDVAMAANGASTIDHALVASPERRREIFINSLPGEIALRLTESGFKGGSTRVMEILGQGETVYTQEKLDALTVLFTTLDNNLPEGIRHHTQAALKFLRSKKPGDALEVKKGVLVEPKLLRDGIKKSADALGQFVQDEMAEHLGVIVRTDIVEGKADDVEEAMDGGDVFYPSNIKSAEQRSVLSHFRRNDLVYVTAEQMAHPLTKVISDVLEGTDNFADFPNVNLSGSTSTFVFGWKGGILPDGYAGQLMTHMGSREKALAFHNAKVTIDGNEYDLNDPNTYADHPEAFRNFLLFLYDGDLSKVQEEVVVMEREREDAFVGVLEAIQKELAALPLAEGQKAPELKITKITSGTIVPGIKAILSPAEFKAAFGEDYGPLHMTVLTIGGSAEAYLNLSAAALRRESGAVGTVSYYSKDMGKDDKGNTMHDQTRRHIYSNDEIAKIRKTHTAEDADAILNKSKVYNAEDVDTTDMEVRIASITNIDWLHMATADENTSKVLAINAKAVNVSDYHVGDYKLPESGPNNVGVLAQFGLSVTDQEGAHTGKDSIPDLKSRGVTGAIIAHVETVNDALELGATMEQANLRFAKQAKMAFDAGLNENIIAVPGDDINILDQRLALIKDDLSRGNNASRLLIAIEPPAAIGTGAAAATEDAQRMAINLRAHLADEYGDEVADQVRILYGGSVTGDNAEGFINQMDIDGVLVGGKSLTADDLGKIAKVLEQKGPKFGRVPYLGGNWKANNPKDEYPKFVAMLKKLNRNRFDIGIAPRTTAISEFTTALIALGPTRTQQLAYNQRPLREFTERYQSEAEKRDAIILQQLITKAGGKPALVRRTVTASNQGAPVTTVVAADGSVRLINQYDSLHVSEALPADSNFSLMLAPVERGKVVQHVSVVLNGEVNVGLRDLVRALRDANIPGREIRSTGMIQVGDQVLDGKTYSLKVYKDPRDSTKTITMIDFNLLYDVGANFASDILFDNNVVVQGVPALKGVIDDKSRVKEKAPTGAVKNLFINGVRGRIGLLTLAEMLWSNSDHIQIPLVNGTTAAELREALLSDSVHGRLFGSTPGESLVVEKSTHGNEYLVIRRPNRPAMTIRVTNDRPDDVSKFPLAEYGIDIVIDAVDTQEQETLQGYMDRFNQRTVKYELSGAKMAINTSPADDGADRNVVTTVMFGVNAHRVTTQDICAGASCTTGSLAAPERAWKQDESQQERDIQAIRDRQRNQEPAKYVKIDTLLASVLTNHAYTGSNKTVDSNSGRSASTLNLGKTGIAKALPEVLPHMFSRQSMSADSLRYNGSDVSISEITQIVEVPESETLTTEMVKNRFREAVQSPLYNGVIDLREGAFDSKQVLGSSASATILMDSIYVEKVPGQSNRFMVHYKSWYDNERGFASRMKDLIFSASERIDRYQPKAKTVNDLLNAIARFNAKENVLEIVGTSDLNVIIHDRNAFTRRYGLGEYLLQEAQYSKNPQVSVAALQILRRAANFLDIQSGSMNDVRGIIVPIHAGTGSGSNYMMMQAIAQAARRAGAIAIDLDEQDERIDKQKGPTEQNREPVLEAGIPNLENLEPGYIRGAVAAGYMAAIKSGFRGVVFLNRNNINVNPDNFMPFNQFEGLDYAGNPLQDAIKHVNDQIREAVESGAFNAQVDITPLIAYAEKHATRSRNKEWYILEAIGAITTATRALEKEIGFLSGPIALSFTYTKGLNEEEFSAVGQDINAELRRELKAVPTYFGPASGLKEAVNTDPKTVQYTVLREIVDAATDKNNIEARSLRFEMINFMEGLIYLNESITTPETKQRIADQGLSKGGQRYRRHAVAFNIARGVVEGLQSSGKSDNEIFDAILTKTLPGLKADQTAALDKLVEFMFRAFRNDIFLLSDEEGRQKIEAELLRQAQHEVAGSGLMAQADAIEQAINAPFNLNRNLRLVPRNGRTSADEYQEWSATTSLTAYQEPSFKPVDDLVGTDHQKITQAVRERLAEIAQEAGAKAILAADESTGTLRGRFERLGIKDTPENVHAYREMFFKTPGLENYVSGVILFTGTLDEQFELVRDHLLARGIHIFLKSDEGLKDMDPKSKETGNLEQRSSLDLTTEKDRQFLRNKIRKYVPLGITGTKYRTTIFIGQDKKGNWYPSQEAIEASAVTQAWQAKIAIEEGVVPIVEPEIMFEGNVDIQRVYEITDLVLKRTYEKLKELGVDLSKTILKPNMVVSGYKFAHRVTPDVAAEMTLRVLLKRVPAAVGSINFLSGGQPGTGATDTMREINKIINDQDRLRTVIETAVRELRDENNPVRAAEVESLIDSRTRIARAPWLVRSSFGRENQGNPNDGTNGPVDRFAQAVKARDAGNEETAAAILEGARAEFATRFTRIYAAAQGQEADHALLGEEADHVQGPAKIPGGINFDPAMYSIQIKRDGNGFPLPMDQQPIAKISVRGFRGIIMSITRANLPLMLGFTQPSQQLAMNN